MNNNDKISKDKNLNTSHKKISLENEVIQKSLDPKIDFDAIDNANAYYSERYGWTLRKN